jgi:hypothetical protein
MDATGSSGTADWSERAKQEREVALRHSVVAAEFALASEAVHVGRALRELGLDFDPVTFVAVRVLDGGSGDAGDPVEALSWFVADGAIERSVAMAIEELDDENGDA